MAPPLALAETFSLMGVAFIVSGFVSDLIERHFFPDPEAAFLNSIRENYAENVEMMIRIHAAQEALKAAERQDKANPKTTN